MIQPLDEARLREILDFLKAADGLKNVYRAAYLSDNSRHESGAEHSWHACLFAVLLHEGRPDVDLAHVLLLLVIHDLVEVYAGDAPLHDESARAKDVKEKLAAEQLFSLLPPDLGSMIRSWWEEYEATTSEESKFANEIDRIQAIAQNVFAGGKTWKDYSVTESIARERNLRALGFEPSMRQVFEILWSQASDLGLWHPSAP